MGYNKCKFVGKCLFLPSYYENINCRTTHFIVQYSTQQSLTELIKIVVEVVMITITPQNIHAYIHAYLVLDYNKTQIMQMLADSFNNISVNDPFDIFGA